MFQYKFGQLKKRPYWLTTDRENRKGCGFYLYDAAVGYTPSNVAKGEVLSQHLPCYSSPTKQHENTSQVKQILSYLLNF